MLVYVRGAGDHRHGRRRSLVRAGVSVVMADIAVPTCIRRTISFCEAIRLGEVEVEGHSPAWRRRRQRRLQLPRPKTSPSW